MFLHSCVRMEIDPKSQERSTRRILGCLRVTGFDYRSWPYSVTSSPRRLGMSSIAHGTDFIDIPRSVEVATSGREVVSCWSVQRYAARQRIV